jgi:hypothetical protein
MKGEGTVLNKLSYRTPKALDIPLAGQAETEVLLTASHTIYPTNRFIIAQRKPRWRVWKSSRPFAESCFAAYVILLGHEPEYYSGSNSVIRGCPLLYLALLCNLLSICCCIAGCDSCYPSRRKLSVFGTKRVESSHIELHKSCFVRVHSPSVPKTE